jgi:hypothetical protein
MGDDPVLKARASSYAVSLSRRMQEWAVVAQRLAEDLATGAAFSDYA